MEGTGGPRNSIARQLFRNNRRLLAQRSTGLALYALPDAASLIVILLLSIGLWAAIWEAVDLLASAV